MLFSLLLSIVCVCLSSIYVFWLTLSRIFKPFFLNIYAKLYLFLKTNKWKQYFEGEIYKSEVKIPVISLRFFCMWSYPRVHLRLCSCKHDRVQ